MTHGFWSLLSSLRQSIMQPFVTRSPMACVKSLGSRSYFTSCVVWRHLFVFGLLGLAGCGSDRVDTQINPNPSTLYWALTLDQHAITLSTVSPYDTVRLTAIPRT